MRSDFSNTVTLWPARFNCAAAARPAGPDPITATFFQVRDAGGRGTIQPSSNARSTIDSSIDEIVPVRDQVAERAALVAERNAAIHAARRLPRDLFNRIRVVNVFKITKAFDNW